MLLDVQQLHTSADRAADVENCCPACRAGKPRELGFKRGYVLSECAKCGTIFTIVGRHRETVARLYDHYYDYARFTAPLAATFSLERLVRSCEPFRSTNRWLDVGFGEGSLLEIAERHGWNCYGTEVSPPAVEHGRERGWIVTSDAEADSRFPSSGFDVVTMIELIEHVPSPQEFFHAAARWLRPGGLLYVTTPNAQSLNRRLLGLEWTIFAPPEHVTIWTSGGLSHALKNAGFQIELIRTEGLNPCEILARWRVRKSGAGQVDRNSAAFALNSAFSSSPFRRALKAGINHCLTAFRAGDTLKVWGVRRNE